MGQHMLQQYLHIKKDMFGPAMQDTLFFIIYSSECILFVIV